RVRAAVVRVEVADEAPLLPGLDAEDVLRASAARWQRDRRRGRLGLLVHDHATRARLAAGGGRKVVPVLGPGNDRFPGELDARHGPPGKARRLELGLGRAARQHTFEWTRVVTRARQVDDPRQIHDQPLRSTLGDLEAWLDLVVTRKPAEIGRASCRERV